LPCWVFAETRGEGRGHDKQTGVGLHVDDGQSLALAEAAIDFLMHFLGAGEQGPIRGFPELDGEARTKWAAIDASIEVQAFLDGRRTARPNTTSVRPVATGQPLPQKNVRTACIGASLRRPAHAQPGKRRLHVLAQS
jgi:hypothetical protein